MARILFVLILLIHGMIHFLGFAKAFNYGNITQLTKPITKTGGLFWLFVALLLIISAVLFLMKKEYWPMIAIIAAIISQLLIFGNWKDAKYGTIANIILLLVAVPAFADFRFQQTARIETAALLSKAQPSGHTIIPAESIVNLPPVIQKWLTRSGVTGKENIYAVWLRQEGEMRTSPGGKWMSFEAEEYFTPQQPAFIWNADVKMNSFIYLTGKDKYEDGKGTMLIKAMSLLPVANELPSEKINKSAMLRYLGEICWFPQAAINKYIQWEAIDSLSAKATMNYQGLTVSGIFIFTENGDMRRFTADRYYQHGKQSTLEKWSVRAIAYKDFQGIRVPSKCKVSWNLETGDFNWLNLDVTGLAFNNPELYHLPGVN